MRREGKTRDEDGRGAARAGMRRRGAAVGGLGRVRPSAAACVMKDTELEIL